MEERLNDQVSPSSPATRSPAKHSAKLGVESTATPLEESPSSDLLDTFPATNQVASESFLKEMMIALRASIQQSFTSALNNQIAANQIDDPGEKVDHVENKMGEFSAAHNGLVEAHNQLEEDVKSISAKLADVEDRNRRNNVKLRGVSESISNSVLIPYIQQLMTTLLKSVLKQDLIIDRAHRLPKPKGIPESAPHNIIIRVHFYHIKEELMQAARKVPQLPEPYQKVKLFADLSQFTIQARKRLHSLFDNIIFYTMGFPHQTHGHKEWSYPDHQNSQRRDFYT